MLFVENVLNHRSKALEIQFKMKKNKHEIVKFSNPGPLR